MKPKCSICNQVTNKIYTRVGKKATFVSLKDYHYCKSCNAIEADDTAENIWKSIAMLENMHEKMAENSKIMDKILTFLEMQNSASLNQP